MNAKNAQSIQCGTVLIQDWSIFSRRSSLSGHNGKMRFWLKGTVDDRSTSVYLDYQTLDENRKIVLVGHDFYRYRLGKVSEAFAKANPDSKGNLLNTIECLLPNSSPV